MPEERRWTDADRDLVARTLLYGRSLTADEEAAAVLDAIVGSRRWIRVRVEDLDLPGRPDDRQRLMARLEAEWRLRGWAPVEETRREVAAEIDAYAARMADVGFDHVEAGVRRSAEIARQHATTPTEGDEDAEPVE